MMDATMNHQLLYTEHLSDSDMALLAAAVGSDPESVRRHVQQRPEVIDEILAEPSLFELVFETPDPDLRVRLTPFLLFGILINKVASELENLNYAFEWAGAGQRLPVFDVASMREFLAAAARRYLLVEFLASFTKVASGRIWVKTRRGYQSRRYSELDLVRMVDVVLQLPPAQRPGGYRRLGDIALFLTGVFPDHTARHPIAPLHRERLVKMAGLDASAGLVTEDLAFHEILGAAWYRRAVEAAAALVGRGPEELLYLADNFTAARRVLNYLADNYLHHYEAGLGRPA